MSHNKPWQESLDAFLANKAISTDTRVLARALAETDQKADGEVNQEIKALERALHIEKNLDDIGLQPLPEALSHNLQQISKAEKQQKVVWVSFRAHWKKASAIAATACILALLTQFSTIAPNNQQPSVAQIEQAEKELALAFNYIAQVNDRSFAKVNQALDESMRRPINHNLMKPFSQLQESL